MSQSTRSTNIKPELDYETLRDIIDLALWAGQLLLQNGAETARVEESVHRLGTALGAHWMDILVSPNAIMVTTTSGQEFRTKIRRVVAMGVNMQILAEVRTLVHQAERGQIDRAGTRERLTRLSRLKPQYNRWTVVVLVGLGCAAFSRLFGGDWPVFLVTFAAASVAQFVRQELQRRHFNSLIVVVVTSFFASLIGSSATFYNLSPQPQTAMIASVILLVPGIHLVNAMRDLVSGHLVTGMVRGVVGGMVSLGIALGLVMAMRLVGISGL
ncbi:MAG: threonine/serine exporter family protein [Chloroflexi bacterium]|nr:threonine/serine exporter family protein [Chloroflexota bacterium]MCC6893134.1 threonine/serine exporter family protein [Anaerolineae bacterium]